MARSFILPLLTYLCLYLCVHVHTLLPPCIIRPISDLNAAVPEAMPGKEESDLEQESDEENEEKVEEEDVDCFQRYHPPKYIDGGIGDIPEDASEQEVKGAVMVWILNKLDAMLLHSKADIEQRTRN